MKLRCAELIDKRFLFELANDPVVRSVSFSQGIISWQEHCHWFKKKLKDADSRFYICENAGGAPIGQVRFDKWNDTSYQISVSLISEVRGKGLGSALISSGVSRFFQEFPIDKVIARVKPDNVASRKSFEKAGFKETSPDVDFPFPHKKMIFNNLRK